ncbi:helix-turn-helix domain-containing protein [Streptomyces sp. NBC_00842]|uniref:helix-turn-helix domain-containing protein n=1 Tax=Streptomyces sp. NBC_00842 TaxID=2975848 RepID=UPI00386791BB|nr:helix-turn-helix domain-containing protein [Streptomyces sp. NBC_00842]
MPITPQPDWVVAQRQAVGERIRYARVDANLTQMKLAGLIGVDHRTIHRIEHGTSDPGLGLLIMLADAVRVPLADLVRE